MSRGYVLPADWKPSEAEIEYGHDLGLDDVQIAAHAENMRLWAWANSNRQIARKASWGLAFRGWMRREATKSGLKPREKQQNDWSDARAKLKQFTDGNGGGSGPVSPPIGLFPATQRK